MMVYVTDAYMRHSASLSLNFLLLFHELVSVSIYLLCPKKLIRKYAGINAAVVHLSETSSVEEQIRQIWGIW